MSFRGRAHFVDVEIKVRSTMHFVWQILFSKRLRTWVLHVSVGGGNGVLLGDCHGFHPVCRNGCHQSAVHRSGIWLVCVW